MDGRGLIMVLAAAIATAPSLTGCGEESAQTDFAPAAEPAVAPEPSSKPVGEVARIGGEIEGLAFDPRSRTLAAVARDPGILSLIDPGSLAVRDEVEVGEGTRHLELVAPGGPVLVPAQFTDELWLVDPASGDAEAVPVGESPHDVAALGDVFYTADEGGDTVTVVEDGDAVVTLEAPVQPGAIEAVAGWIAVVAVAERVVSVYNPAAREVVASVPVGVGPTHAVALGERVFVADTQGGAVIELRVARDDPTPAEQGVVAIGDAPYALAIDRRRERLWVTATGRNEVIAIDVRGGRMAVGRSYPTVRQPNSVAVDERTGDVFVASRSDGLVQRIDTGPIDKRGSDGAQ